MTPPASVISRFRTGFWIRQFLQYVGGLFVTVFCFIASIDNGRIDFRHAGFWMGSFMLILFALFFVKFIFEELKRLTVTDSGIHIKYLISKRTVFVPFAEIKKFTTKHIRQRVGAMQSDGFSELEIELYDGRLIVFDEDQFDNYSDIKNYIYQNRKITQ